MTRLIDHLASKPAPRQGAWHRRAHLSGSVAVAATLPPHFSAIFFEGFHVINSWNCGCCEFLFLASLPTRTRTPRILESPSLSLLEREKGRERLER